MLGDILDHQIEDGSLPSLGRSRISQALTMGPALTKEETAVLLRSPHARAVYREIARDVRSENLDAIVQAAIDMTATNLAAASAEDIDKVEIEGKGFNITIYRIGDDVGPLVILVRLSKAYMDAIHPMTRMRLFDMGGLEWLRGIPDGDGQLTAEWDDSSVDLVGRARRHQLILEPT